MLKTTVSLLSCPQKNKKTQQACAGSLNLFTEQTCGKFDDVWTGKLDCKRCKAVYPILSGVAILVEDVKGYLFHHIKGISKVVPDSSIPKVFLDEYREVKIEMEVMADEHIDEDLESARVTALYVMTHYLRASSDSNLEWWKPKEGSFSPLIDQLIREHWDCGPFFEIEKRVKSFASQPLATVELGCGVGGLFSVLKNHCKNYLGVDSSFASIALARHLNLGTAYPESIQIPGDLLQGGVSRKVKIQIDACDQVDFIVGEIDALPLKQNEWDLSLALNAIDMLDDPSVLPKAQFDLIRDGGYAIQSGPYVWHQKVAKKLRKEYPSFHASAEMVEGLYQKAGFTLESKMEHVPWLFFKQARQLEIYSVHVLCARKSH